MLILNERHLKIRKNKYKKMISKKNIYINVRDINFGYFS